MENLENRIPVTRRLPPPVSYGWSAVVLVLVGDALVKAQCFHLESGPKWFDLFWNEIKPLFWFDQPL